MTDLDTLLAIEAIKRLKARYFRCVDGKDWAGYAALFTPDARFEAEDMPGRVLEGGEAIAAMASAGLEDCVSVHHGHCPEIDILSDTEASGVWAMDDLLTWRDPAKSPIHAMHGYGHYHETYRRIEGAWHIATLRLTRLQIDTTVWDEERR
jgi:hypothetical protein